MDSTLRRIIVIMICLLSSLGQAYQATELFLQGNKYYKEGKFDEALKSYQRIDKKGPAVWYNMGNCYYKKNDLVQAIVCWERGARNAPAFLKQNALYNCSHAYQNMSKNYESSIWQRVTEPCTRGGRFIGLQLFFIMTWFFLWIALVNVRKKSVLFLILAVVLLVSILGGSIIWYHYREQRCEYGIIVEPSVPVYVGPHAHYHTIDAVEKGDKIKLITRRETWGKIVKEKDGTQGWIPLATLEII